MKTLLTIALLTTLVTTASARTFEKADLSKAIKAYTVDVTRKANTINLKVNPNELSTNTIKFTVKRAYPAATYIKVKCNIKCYVKFTENVQPLLNAPKHFYIFPEGRGH